MLKNSLKIKLLTKLDWMKSKNLYEFYGESRKYGAKYAQPIIKSPRVEKSIAIF